MNESELVVSSTTVRLRSVPQFNQPSGMTSVNGCDLKSMGVTGSGVTRHQAKIAKQTLQMVRSGHESLVSQTKSNVNSLLPAKNGLVLLYFH